MGTISHIKSVTIADGGNTDIVRPSDWNSAHAYTLQDAVVVSGGNTAGVGAYISSGTLYLAGGNNITLSQNANTVSVVGAGPGTLSMYPAQLPGSTAVSTYYSGSTSGAGTTGYTFSIYIVPFFLPAPVAFSAVRQVISNQTAAGTGSITHIYSMGFYSDNGGTLSLIDDCYAGIFASMNSNTAVTYSIWSASTGRNSTGSGANGPFFGINAASIASSQGNFTAHIANAPKNIRWDCGAQTFSEGNYWYAYAFCSVSTGANCYSNVGILQSNAVSSVALLDFGVTTATLASIPGWGAISTTFTSQSTAATWFPMPTAINRANMTSSATSVFRYHFPLMRGI